MDVRPHPHIGLATLTYLVEGSILHRDTLGSRQEIVPGDVNWPDARRTARSMQGIQSWLALPRAHEEPRPASSIMPPPSRRRWPIPASRSA